MNFMHVRVIFDRYKSELNMVNNIKCLLLLNLIGIILDQKHTDFVERFLHALCARQANRLCWVAILHTSDAFVDGDLWSTSNESEDRSGIKFTCFILQDYLYKLLIPPAKQLIFEDFVVSLILSRQMVWHSLKIARDCLFPHSYLFISHNYVVI